MIQKKRIFYIILPAFSLVLTAVLVSLAQAGANGAADGGSTPNIGLSPFAVVDFSPTDVTNSGVTGDERLFVTLQDGRISVIEADGTVQATPFLSITDRVSGGGELGLLSLTFDPDYDTNGYFYVNYTHQEDSQIYSRVSRFSVSGNPNAADPNSEFIILSVEQPGPDNNGGDLLFGPDGYLYIGLGDGEDDQDNDNRAQDPQELLGKLLRIDTSATTSTTNYLIPNDNPFVGDPGTLDEIWAMGLRNPWRFSFDSATGDLYLADVGYETSEEVNYQPAASSGGENYGWRCYEGNNAFNTAGCGPMGDYDFPIHTYNHNLPGCAVVGGYVYRGSDYPDLVGHYFFADYCFGHVWSLDTNNGQQLAVNENFGNVLFTSFGEDINGELYVTDLLNNTIYQIVETAENSYLPFVRAD
ncbi:MAG: PQQ-dependent sugar dehydrogenase [Candidatus Promineifilaceae bacterium]